MTKTIDQIIDESWVLKFFIHVIEKESEIKNRKFQQFMYEVYRAQGL